VTFTIRGNVAGALFYNAQTTRNIESGRHTENGGCWIHCVGRVPHHDDVSVRRGVCAHRLYIRRRTEDELWTGVVQQVCASCAIECHDDVNPVTAKRRHQRC
jgi:hypothetical protein